MLRAGDAIPHFTVRTPGGEIVAYRDIWQQRNLVLILMAPQSPALGGDADRIAIAANEHADSAWIVTADAIEGLPQPGVVVADRWGEIVHVSSTSVDAGLPDVDDLIEWLDFTRMRCPECEGETK